MYSFDLHLFGMVESIVRHIDGMTGRRDSYVWGIDFGSRCSAHFTVHTAIFTTSGVEQSRAEHVTLAWPRCPVRAHMYNL